MTDPVPTDASPKRAGEASSQLPLDLPHRPSLARDDLIVTEANRLAVSAVDAWPAWPHPVLLIVGPPGAGKSHLAAAWAEMAGAKAFDGQPPDECAGPFALVLDDVDRVPRDETAVFSVVNAARLGGGTVLATARVHPGAMDLTLPDLRSRLKAATVAELGAPDDALLEGVLAKLFADRQMTVEPKLLRYAALRVERSLDAANQLVAALDRASLAGKTRLSRSLLARVLGEAEESRGKPGESDAEIGHKGRTRAALGAGESET